MTRQTGSRSRRRDRRVRPTLLVLLWIWAICVFVVVDLFRNVSEFDAIRPRAEVYRTMRYAAHKMVGEPYLDGDFGRHGTVLVPHAVQDVDAALRTALHPTAPYRGGVAAVRRAAELGGESTQDLLLDLLEHRELVIAKLPLTDVRDDLDLLDATIAPLVKRGTACQRDRLAALITTALDTEDDAETRLRFRTHGRALLRAGQLADDRRAALEVALKQGG